MPDQSQLLEKKKSAADALNEISKEIRKIRESEVASGSAVYEQNGYLISVSSPANLPNDSKE